MPDFLRFFPDIFKNKDEILLRDYLALERTKLANERTLLAYSRTSLYILLGGIAFLEIQEFKNIQWIGSLALGLSSIIFIIGIYRYTQIKARLSDYYKWSKAENSHETGEHEKD